MDWRLKVERLRRNVAMLRRGAVGQEDALRLLGELDDVQGSPRPPQAADAVVGGGVNVGQAKSAVWPEPADELHDRDDTSAVIARNAKSRLPRRQPG